MNHTTAESPLLHSSPYNWMVYNHLSTPLILAVSYRSVGKIQKNQSPRFEVVEGVLNGVKVV